MQILISCSLMSRFFLNLRSVAYNNPMLLPRGTTGFALDTTSPQVLIARIMRRKYSNQATALEAVGDIGTRRRLGQEDTTEVSDDRDRISMMNIEFGAGRDREIVGPKDRKSRHNIVV